MRTTLYGHPTTGDPNPQSEAQLRARVPPVLLEGIDRYVSQHYEAGHFLMAVLSNDLREACGRADLESARALHDIVKYVFNCVPMECWGSPEHVDAWLDVGRRVRSGEHHEALT